MRAVADARVDCDVAVLPFIADRMRAAYACEFVHAIRRKQWPDSARSN